MSDDPSASSNLIRGAPFGVRGWIKLRSHTDPLSAYSIIVVWCWARAVSGRNYRIEASGRSGGALTVKLAGSRIGTRPQALRARKFVCRAASCRSGEAGTFYRADLIGCEAVNLDGLVWERCSILSRVRRRC